MSYTPANATILSGLLSDREIAACFSIKVEFAAWSLFESALARAQAGAGIIPAEAANAISAACAGFEPDPISIGTATARDGVPIPEFLRQLRARIARPHADHLHYGATSQDVIDTSLAMRLKPVCERMLARLGELGENIAQLDSRFGSRAMMGRTRMQQALPVTVSRRLSDWSQPLARHHARLISLMPGLLILQLGGAVGTFEG
ncbi:MAG: lyase family protein, partial [Rhizobiaceae bacterium]